MSASTAFIGCWILLVGPLLLWLMRDPHRDSGTMPRFWPLIRRILANRNLAREQACWKAAFLNAQARNRTPIILPDPLTVTSLQDVLTDHDRLREYFTPAAVEAGTTTAFLKAYASLFVANHPAAGGTVNEADDPRDQMQRVLFDMIRTRPASPQLTCRHLNAVPVEDAYGQRVASLCPDCDQQLPAEWTTTADLG